jgi:hypothetical protein
MTVSRVHAMALVAAAKKDRRVPYLSSVYDKSWPPKVVIKTVDASEESKSPNLKEGEPVA